MPTINVILLSDYKLGIGKTIDHEVDESPKIPISVDINDECNHDGAIDDDRDVGGLVLNRAGDLDWQDRYVHVTHCTKCGATDWGEGFEK